jgi:uncharacterized iron-regulated protein
MTLNILRFIMAFHRWIGRAMLCMVCLFWGCAAIPKKLAIEEISTAFPPDTIISTETGKPVSFENLIAELAKVQVIYVGEQHTDILHHEIQLKVISECFRRNSNIRVGMEMFDRTYQPILNQWTNGELDQKLFLQKTHWYANWKFNFELYQPILDFIRNNRIPVVGLNIPFHIPAKIATGGVESLSDEEKKHLPRQIDTSNALHRAYIRDIYEKHRVKGRENFEFFYMAQCVWEEVMAETIALNSNGAQMIVLAGNGHIMKKFGIPDRAYRRTRASFKTICPMPAGGKAERTDADYIWVTRDKNKQPIGKMLRHEN